MGVGDNFTDKFIINSSKTAMAYVGENGNYYYYDINNDKEIQLDIENGSDMAAMAEGKVVYVNNEEGELIFTCLYIDENRKTEVGSTGDIIQPDYEINYIGTGYDDTSFKTEIDYNIYDEEANEWYGFITNVEGEY